MTDGATIAEIAKDLGVTDATLSTWVKAAGVPVRGARLASVPVYPGDELAALRARVTELEAAEHGEGHLAGGGNYFAGETTW